MRSPRTLLVAAVMAIMAVTTVSAQRAGFGSLFYEGEVVSTVVPPAASPHEGQEPLFVIMEGAEGQLPVVATAPGDHDYRGGKWAFHRVTWNTTPYLLTSRMAVMNAADAGDVTVLRVPENDFKCPVQRR